MTASLRRSMSSGWSLTCVRKGVRRGSDPSSDHHLPVRRPDVVVDAMAEALGRALTPSRQRCRQDGPVNRSSVRHPVFARLYARVGAAAEAKGAADHRNELLAGLSGRVVEVGAGNGLNFSH